MILDPGGRRLDDAYARELAAGPPIVLLCGRYEGFDHRVHTHVATEALSIGPYVVSGGEMAAMVVIDAVVRHLEGALGDVRVGRARVVLAGARGPDRASALHAAARRFAAGTCPEVLLSGDHGAVDRWRVAESERRTEAAGDP